MLDIEKVREQFPILKQTINGNPLVYFDNAATTQKPQRFINALVDYYARLCAMVMSRMKFPQIGLQALRPSRLEVAAYVSFVAVS